MPQKNLLRKKYLSLREKMTEETIDRLSLEIANRALELPVWNKDYFHIFLSIASKKEVNTHYLLHILQGKDKNTVISKTDFRKGTMNHFLLQDNTVLKNSSYGIPEPVSGIAIQPEVLDVVFVPLLAYDRQGNRVGYGKGFYDRFLKNCKPEAVFVGLSFFDPEPEIGVQSTDIPLHYCITPEKIYSF